MLDSHIILRETHIIGVETRERILSPGQCSGMQRHHMSLMGTSDTDADFCFVRKRPSMAQFLLCLKGQGAVLHHGQWQDIGPGEAYVTPPHLAHAYRAKGHWRVLWVAYTPKRGLIQDVPTVISVETEVLEQAVEQALAEFYRGADDRVLAAWLRIIDTHIQRAVGGEQRADALERVWDMVLHDIGADWQIADLASELQLSEEHFRRLCLKRYGTSPARYLCQLRMQHAANLLNSTKIKISDIANQVGYQNPFAFATAFKRLHGKSPSTFRSGNM